MMVYNQDKIQKGDELMLTCNSFTDIYWAHYVSLEKEFLNTLKYVSLSNDNYSAYSETYSKLMLEIGSEIDVVLKIYCKLLQPTFNGNCITDYMTLISVSKAAFSTQEVSISTNEVKVQPWINWSRSDGGISPFWWTAYNKIKHNRTGTGTINGVTKEYYKFGNQENTLLALAGLYQTLLHIYYELAISEHKKVLIPLPGSRIFELTGGPWSSIQFYRDYAFYVDNGSLIMESSSVYY